MNSRQMHPWRINYNRRSEPGARQGFTLAEVMVALFVLVSGMIAASMFFASMARAARFTDDAIAATGLAQARLEAMLEQPYASMSNGVDSIGSFTRSWTVLHSNNVAAVDVTVSWFDTGGKTNTLSLSSVRAP